LGYFGNPELGQSWKNQRYLAGWVKCWLNTLGCVIKLNYWLKITILL